MSIDLPTVKKLCKLSMLKYEEESASATAAGLSNIIDMVSQLQQANTDNIQPMASSVSAASTPEREDKVTDTDNRDKLLAVAPAKEMGFFVVPRVVE